MSLAYNIKKYVQFNINELSALLTTCVLAGFILTFRDWGGAEFSVTEGVTALLLTAAFLFGALLLVIALCKIIGIKVGYIVEYESNMLGLFLGMVLTAVSNGFLPLFVPGGFKLVRPARLMIGHWRGDMKGWEMGLITGTFPLLLLAFVLLLNPLYLLTGEDFFLKFIVAICLTALYSLIPLPNIALDYSGRVRDLYSHLKGTTFGLEIIYASGVWYWILGVTVLLFCVLSYILTRAEIGVGILLYALLVMLTFVAAWVYYQFFIDDGRFL